MAWSLITGGSKRLGATLAVFLAQKGYDIVIHYHRDKSEADNVVNQCKAFGVQAEAIQGDFSSIETLTDFSKRYLKEFPETVHLINNVGPYLIQSALKTTVEEWTSLFQSNFLTPLFLIQQLVPSITRQKGRIINIGVSGINHLSGSTYASAYKMIKTSLFLLTESLALELASQGVCINMVSPGQLDISVDLPKDTTKLPMGRPGTSQEVANVVEFLLNPMTTYVTGQNIEVAGGLGLKC